MRPSAARILMLVENHFPQDTRVKNEAALLREAGYDVSVIALRKKGQVVTEVVNGIQVYRLPSLELFKKTSHGNLSRIGLLFLKLRSSVGYLVEYCYFTAACLGVSTYVFVRRGFDVIQRARRIGVHANIRSRQVSLQILIGHKARQLNAAVELQRSSQIA